MPVKSYPFDPYGYSEIRVIDDTDCACEGDDAFAIAHLLLTSKFDVRAINAANFLHRDDSVEQSFEAILRLLEAMDMSGEVNVLRGGMPMRSETDYDRSPASDFIVAEALRDDPRPLFVVSHGAITNIAVALKTAPEIAGQIHCIWIGGAPYPAGGWEFNLCNDIVAARVVMDSGVSLWQVPANAYSMMRVSFASLMENVYPCGKVGKYLCEQLWDYNRRMQKLLHGGAQDMPIASGNPDDPLAQMLESPSPESYTHFCSGEAWQLGDSPVAGLMLNCQPYDREMIGSPYINDDGAYTLRPDNPHKIAVYRSVDSQFILNDLYAKLRYQYGNDSGNTGKGGT